MPVVIPAAAPVASSRQHVVRQRVPARRHWPRSGRKASRPPPTRSSTSCSDPCFSRCHSSSRRGCQAVRKVLRRAAVGEQPWQGSAARDSRPLAGRPDSYSSGAQSMSTSGSSRCHASGHLHNGPLQRPRQRRADGKSNTAWRSFFSVFIPQPVQQSVFITGRVRIPRPSRARLQTPAVPRLTLHCRRETGRQPRRAPPTAPA